ncbi:hypothetical protein [Kocuria sp. HSID16901]|nr:hypothetical protein [Kocuria sp. HSID16901]
MHILNIVLMAEHFINFALGLILFALALWAFISALGASDYA